MSYRTTFLYDNPADFDYNHQELVVTDAARLALVADPLKTIDLYLADDAGSVYDNTKAEFVGGVCKQKPAVTDPSVLFYASYSDVIDPELSVPSGTSSVLGGAVVTSGSLDLSQNAAELHHVFNSAVALGQTGAVRFTLLPHYSNSPTVTEYMFCISTAETVLGYADNIRLYHDTDGVIKLQMYDSLANLIYDGIVGSWAPTEDQPYLIEFDFDLTAGATRVFIDGVQLGSTITATGTRVADMDILILGQNYIPPVPA